MEIGVKKIMMDGNMDCEMEENTYGGMDGNTDGTDGDMNGNTEGNMEENTDGDMDSNTDGNMEENTDGDMDGEMAREIVLMEIWMATQRAI